mmetsp:Transcript_12088/g.19513  ORF Transcript_12088/g.19513 Transcript_12088/m.19513 type:complete len:147 (+) Transcript_12088:146-586(+)|eukprot:CAMPEP_0184346586 /NCGR_PEP_ID=MMETSP1089-20130417/14822_1 /TAXON_ID=38269 ORGANISM="Gloeochaete wittrockiana, Strain SAG46.84" /NCGR_SAMPLE_ID=MMETSP1089 /ASSEMBLY_ACC=CAM_ASM_000445 /LENGTH=146 /DNA_ID=CAMNT_0026677315 /DNA_START=147 /DNA_END=587 /DNA_ORIENTATION=-
MADSPLSPPEEGLVSSETPESVSTRVPKLSLNGSANGNDGTPALSVSSFLTLGVSYSSSAPTTPKIPLPGPSSSSSAFGFGVGAKASSSQNSGSQSCPEVVISPPTPRISKPSANAMKSLKNIGRQRSFGRTSSMLSAPVVRMMSE